MTGYARRARACSRALGAGAAAGRRAQRATSSSHDRDRRRVRLGRGRAVINIGAVLGLLPVVGVPLPLVSCGGSVAASARCVALAGHGDRAFARREPGACRGAGRPKRPVQIARWRCCRPGGREAAVSLYLGAAGRRRDDQVTWRRCCAARGLPAARVDPRDPESPCWAPSRGLEARLVRRPGLRMEIVPRVPLPAPSRRRPAAPAGAWPPRCGPPGRCDHEVRARDVVVGFGGYVSAARLPGRPAAAGPDRRARGERPRRASPTSSAPG